MVAAPARWTLCLTRGGADVGGGRCGSVKPIWGQKASDILTSYYLVEKAKDANIVGILVGTLGVELIKGSGKKAYTLVMGSGNPAKLANFPEILVIMNAKDDRGYERIVKACFCILSQQVVTTAIKQKRLDFHF
ncbi:hypothetical protein ACLOJK_011810 [Asimina triloba]